MMKLIFSKKIILFLVLLINSIILKSQGIVGVGYKTMDSPCNNIKKAACGFKVMSVNGSIEITKGKIKEHLINNSSCSEIEYFEFKKGEVSIVYNVRFKKANCRYSLFLLGRGNTEQEAMKDIDKQKTLIKEPIDDEERFETTLY